ncbi:hypothetical protein FHR32_006018 [Streptosporangium album]|uniref:Site-specific recombinase XerD n=1 Tax=Streptosporangium album TaxID=47479 RepID=A0A7W7RSI8_9ACTN|nr:hypothetical protein [Streptosporangium album]MBB4937102.1 hypothetical protein [Streptosporangium album]MBB4941641.1 hypothetical protein [Streptosporangium album]
MTTDTQPGVAGDPQVAVLRGAVDHFIDEIIGRSPAARLRLLTELRHELNASLDSARVQAMTDASAQGWGLRRIAEQCDLSHEQVRRLLAGSVDAAKSARSKYSKNQGICRECAGMARRFCTRCGEEEGPLPAGLCQRCTLADALCLVLDDGNGQVSPPLKPLFDGLCAATEPGTVLEWLTGQVRDLLEGLATGRIGLTHEALNSLEPVRTVDHLRDLLVHHGVLPPLDKQLALFERWLPRYLDNLAEPVHARLVGHFATWHVLNRMRRRAAKRRLVPSANDHAKQQVSQAAALLTWLDGRGRSLGKLGQADVDAWFAESTATRRPSLDFLRWCAETGRTSKLTLPTGKVTNPAPITQHRRLELIRVLLTGDRAPLFVRVAGLIVLLYAQPVSRLIRLTTDDLTENDTEMLLRLGDPPVTVPDPFAALLRGYLKQLPRQINSTNPSSAWLFPGQRAGQPASVGGVRDALREAGIPTLAARSATLRQLVLQAPAPVIAVMLGYHHTTTTGTAAEAGSPWSKYAPGDHSK